MEGDSLAIEIELDCERAAAEGEGLKVVIADVCKSKGGCRVV